MSLLHGRAVPEINLVGVRRQGGVGGSSRKSTCRGVEEWKLMVCSGSSENSTAAGVWDMVESRVGSEI